MKSLTKVVDYLFGCHHEHLSRVFTINKRSYRVCCDCGANFDFSLITMKTRSDARDRSAAFQSNAQLKAV